MVRRIALTVLAAISVLVTGLVTVAAHAASRVRESSSLW